MKNFKELEYNEQNEIASLFVNWLRTYSYEVITKVLEKRDEIINNEFAMNLLKELAKRDKEEAKEFEISMQLLLSDFETFSKFDPHNHALTHAGSYRDILYDMYIRNI